MSVVSVDIEQMQKYLKDHVDDWQCRLELADAYEEEGNELRAAYYRWSSKNRKCPTVIVFLDLWVWWWEGSMHVEQQNWIGDHSFWVEIVNFIRSYRREIGAEDDYSNSYLQELEYHTALFLRHKGVI